MSSVDPDEMAQNVTSHLGLHCLPIIQQFLDTTIGSNLYLLKFNNKYGKELRRLNTLGKYGTVIQQKRTLGAIKIFETIIWPPATSMKTIIFLYFCNPTPPPPPAPHHHNPNPNTKNICCGYSI